MDRIENAVDAFLQDYFGFNIPTVQLTDVVEIIIIAFFIYQVLIWIKNTRTWILFRGIMVIVAFLMLAAIFQMHTILWLGDRLFSAGFIAIIILFQPELRKALEQLGRNKFFNALLSMNFSRNIGDRFTEKTITDMVKASFEMGAVKTGALIVIELNDELTEYERTGITLDSLVSRQLLINIFEKNTPLHDGAVLVRGNRIVSATCYLPLVGQYGTEQGPRYTAQGGRGNQRGLRCSDHCGVGGDRSGFHRQRGKADAGCHGGRPGRSAAQHTEGGGCKNRSGAWKIFLGKEVRTCG